MSEFRHHGAGKHGCEDACENEWEEADCSLEGVVAVGELEEQRDVVDWDEEVCGDGGGGDEEEDKSARAEEVRGEYAARWRGEDGEVLRENEEDD